MSMRAWTAIIFAVAVWAGPLAAQEDILRPGRHEVSAHIVHLIEPVRRASVESFSFEGVAVILTVSETGEVVDAVLEETEEAGPAPDIAAEALANARAAIFEPFMRDGVARRARVETVVPLLPPARAPRRRVPFPETAGKDIRIRLERTVCFGTCPAYTVEIRGDGRVTYTGEAYVAVGGVHRRTISRAAVAELLSLFRAADFYSLDNEYVGGVTDNPSQIVTLSIGGRRKTVADYVGWSVGMPFFVTRLEHAIDRAAGADTWVNGDETTAGMLAAEGYDFHSAAAGEALTWMAWEGSEQAALDFLARGAPVGGKPLDEFGVPRGSALRGAASNGSARLVAALIGARAMTDTEAEAALQFAASSLDVSTLDVVLAAGQFDRRQLGQALVAALNNPRYADPAPDPGPIVERLLALNPDVTVSDEEGKTALHGAETPEMVRRLVALGADIEARTEYGDTPLTSAWDEDVILALIDAGADVTVQPEYGGDVRETAIRHNMNRVLERLDRRP